MHTHQLSDPVKINDIATESFKTIDDIARAVLAKREWDDATHLLANTIKEMFDGGFYLTIDDKHQIRALLGARDRKQEAFLRVVDGK